jgi:hypothetical protein
VAPRPVVALLRSWPGAGVLLRLESDLSEIGLKKEIGMGTVNPAGDEVAALASIALRHDHVATWLSSNKKKIHL